MSRSKRFVTWPLWSVCATVCVVLLMHYSQPARGQLASGGSAVHVNINGQPLQFSGQQPVVVHDRVLVPLRGVFEGLGAQVDWNPANQVIIARRAGTRVRLRAGSADASVNGRPVTLDVPAQLFGNRVMVPLRFVSEALGADVRWMEATQTVEIHMGAAPMPAASTPAPPSPANDVAAGQAIFVRSCGNCHTIGTLGRGRIPLDHVGARRSPNWLEVQIRAPEQHHSNMPAFPPARLSDQDLHVLVNYLAGLR